jgi:hypothetical protein
MKHKQYLGPYRHRRRNYPQQYQKVNQPNVPQIPKESMFRGNLVDAMKFGSPGHELSGYVKRKIVIIDAQGNKQIATEKQFFNSAKQLGRIHIEDDEGEF